MPIFYYKYQNNDFIVNNAIVHTPYRFPAGYPHCTSLPAHFHRTAKPDFRFFHNTYKDGEYIKNKVFNQYQPDGYVTDAWCTNLNPQDDIWSKDISVQSDLLTLTYKDDSKLDYYGSNVKEKEKNNLWIWDPYHSDTAEYPGA